MSEKMKNHPAQIRKRRLAYLADFAKGFKPFPDLIKAGVIAEAIRKYGVSKRTARDYAEALLVQMELKEDWTQKHQNAEGSQ